MKSVLRRKVFGSESTEIMMAPNTTATNGTEMSVASAGTTVSVVAGV